MAFFSQVNSLAQLTRELNLLGREPAQRQKLECHLFAQRNYEILDKALQGNCTWTSRIVQCVAHRADPDVKAVMKNAAPFPNKCGHSALYVKAREGMQSRCFILDVTSAQWDLPEMCAHSNTETEWRDYFHKYHSLALPMRPAPNPNIRPVASSYILVSAVDKTTTGVHWANHIARHAFVTHVDSVRFLSAAESANFRAL